MYNSKPLFNPPKTRFKGGQQLGEAWELRVCKLLATHGYPSQVPTPRSGWELDPKTDLDRQGIDITRGPGAWIHTPYHIQCKSSTKALSNPGYLLSKLPQDKPAVLFHQHTKEVQEGVFKEQGMYAILKLEDFLTLTQPDLF